MNIQINKATKNTIKSKNDEKIMEIISKFDYVKRKRLSPLKIEDTYNE